MKKKFKNMIKINNIIFIFIFILFILSICGAKSIYASNSIVKVTNWESLKDTIENNSNSKIKIELSNNTSNSWEADSKITIEEGKEISITSSESIVINRKQGFTESFIENRGVFNIKTEDDDVYITFDGNKKEVGSSNSIISVNSGELSINNVIMQNNKRNDYGGAIYANEAEITIQNSVFSENEGTYGGAIFINSESSNTELDNVQLIKNRTSIGSGGGIYAYGNLMVSGKNTVISNNIAYTYGGGIMAKTVCIFKDGEISDNKATTQAGGGIRADGKLTLNGGTIKNNYANTTGGGIDYSAGQFEQNAGTVENNLADNTGKVKYANDDIYPDPKYIIDWSKDKSLNLTKINPTLLKSFSTETDIASAGAQGITMTDKYIIFAQITSNDENTIINILDKNTLELLNTIDDYCFRHANDMTYNNNTGEIYILTSSKQIAKFKINDNYEMIDLSYVECPRSFSGIAYDSDDNYFIGYANQKIYVMNSDFEDLYNFESPTNLTTQGIGYSDNYIYFTCCESGSNSGYQTYFCSELKWSNIIYVYTMEGTLERTLFIPNTILSGEIESVAFYDNGDLMFHYNISGTVSLYRSKILTNEQKAIQEVANAYWRKDSNIQFESIKRDYLLSPEEATEDNILNTTCHTFAYQIYKQAFNIEIPKGCSELFEYCRIKENTEYVPIFYYTENFTNTSADYSKESEDYKKLLAAFYEGDGAKDNVFLEFIKKLEVGDIITELRSSTSTSAHTMIVYDFIYDEQENKTDCILIESNNAKLLNIDDTKWSGLGGIADKNGDKLEQYGSINKTKLSRRLETYAKAYKDTSKKPICLAVCRPLGSNAKYCYISMDQLKAHNKNSITEISEEYQDIQLTEPSISRLKYKGIDIYKTGSKHTNSVVGLGDEITYTIKIKNNGTTKYEGIEVKEYINPELVECKLENQVNNNGTIELIWSDIDIDVGETKEIKYTVKVKKYIKNLNKNIVSEGYVDNIKSAQIVNKIGAVLSTEEKSKLIESSNNVNYESYENGLELINDIYKNAFGIELDLKDDNNNFLKVSDIIKTNESKDIEVINEKIILNDFYGTWEASRKVTDSSRYYIWGTAYDEVGDQNAKTILKGNLNIGDVILIENDGVETAYIYLEDRIIGANEIIYETKNTNESYDTQDGITKFLADLVSKDAFVIVSPVMFTDLIKTQLDITYNTKDITNNNVTVTVLSNEKILEVEGWTLAEDELTLTKTYLLNAKEEIEVYDYSGNKTKRTIEVNNIDKTSPIVEISYSTTKLTNQNVTATITANEEIQEIEEWALSSDRKSMTKKYNTNTEETITVKDLAGNTATVQVQITNIDKTAPTVQVNYSKTEPTNDSVTATITADKKIQQIEGWEIDSTQKVLTKIFTINCEETVTITDLAGNTNTVDVKVTNIDKTEIEANVKYSTTLLTNQDVTVTITLNKAIKEIKNWELSKDEKKLTKIFTSNAEEELEVQDLAGNTKKVKVSITNIDKISPTVDVSYNITSITNKDVIATITANEEIQEVEGWSLSENGRALTKIYSINKEETITVQDIAGNTTEANIKITNIDKEKPKVDVNYSTTKSTTDAVIVTITADKEMQEIIGWVLSNDKKSMTKTYSENIIETIIVKDMLGNSTDVEILISNIDKNKNDSENKSNNFSETTQTTDITTAKGLLPQAGENKIIISVVAIIFVSLSGIFYIKTKKYKDIK